MENQEDFTTPFLSSMVSVIETVFGENAVKNEIPTQEVTFKSEGFAVIVGISEGGKGSIILDMNQNTALKIAGKMNDENYKKIEEIVLFSNAELANMVAGNGISIINNKNRGLNLRLTPPSIFIGEELEINASHLYSLGASFDMSFGKISLNIELYLNHTD